MVVALLFINGFALKESGFFNKITETAGIDEFANEYALAENEEEDLDYLSLND